MLNEKEHQSDHAERAVNGGAGAHAPSDVLQAYRDQAHHASNNGDVSHAVYFGQEALLLALLRLTDEVAALHAAIERR